MMNKTIKIIATATAALMMIAGVSACGSDTGGDSDKGRVYYLNLKPEASDQWKALAEEYEKETGIETTVQTAASGTYEQTLKSEIAKDNAPTLFQVSGNVGLARWKKYTADMSDSEPYKQLRDQNTALKGDNGEILGVPFVIESYGLIYNKDLLNKYFQADWSTIKSIDDLVGFKALKTVADEIQEHKDDLGVKGAFTSAGFDSSSDWRFKEQLAAIPLSYELDGVTEQPATIKGTYLPEFKQTFDLYLKDSTVSPTELSAKTGNDATSEFALGEGVFYQNGTWAWSDLQKEGVKADMVGAIPIYMGLPGEEEKGLATGSGDNYWAINNKVSEADQQATKDFLKWVITSDKGKKAMTDDMGFVTPFKSFSDMKSSNPIVQADQEMADAGKQDVSWAGIMFMPSQQWKDGVGSAMLEYAQGTGKWDAVKTAYVDGWASEYESTH